MPPLAEALCYFTQFLHLLLLFSLYGSLQIGLSDAVQTLACVAQGSSVCGTGRIQISFQGVHEATIIGQHYVGNWTEPSRTLSETRTDGQTGCPHCTKHSHFAYWESEDLSWNTLKMPGFCSLKTCLECSTGSWKNVNQKCSSAVKSTESGNAVMSIYIRARLNHRVTPGCYLPRAVGQA